MKIENGLGCIEISYRFINRWFYTCLTLLWDDKDTILVDTGLPGQLPDIKAAMEEMGVPYKSLTKVMISHQDIDHIGGLHEIVEELPQVRVFAHEEDKPYIEGAIPYIKPLEDTTVFVLEGEKPKYRAPLTVKVDQTVKDGEVLPYCGGLQVIHTPGHAPGHISLYHLPTRTLIPGDAITYMDGEIFPPPPKKTPSMKDACISIKKFSDLEMKRILFYHGGVCDRDVKQRLEQLIRTL